MAIEKAEKEAIREAVYEIVRSVPRGRATSYGAIAHAVGYPGYSRLVGKIMATCDSEDNQIPAHRVVNSQGVLSGKDSFGTSGEMKQLLEHEGVQVENDRIKNWSTVFWNPMEEIHL